MNPRKKKRRTKAFVTLALAIGFQDFTEGLRCSMEHYN